MNIYATGANWTKKLADAIQNYQAGDVIIVESEEAKELAKMAAGRICPEVDIEVVVRSGE